MPLGIEAYPYLTLLVPILVLGGSWLISRILGFSWWLCALLACFPLVIPELNLPLSESAKSIHPLVLIAGGWAILFVVGLARALVRPASAAIGSRGGVVSAVYLMAMLGALTVVTILYVQPVILERAIPGWRGGLGLVLLAVAAFTMAVSLLKVMKLVAVFAVWGFVSVVLASEIFLHKLPTEVFRDEVTRISPLLSADRFESFISSLSFEFKSEGTPKVAVMRSAPIGIGVRRGESYPERLGFWLKKVTPWTAAKVETNAGDDLSIVQLAELLRSKVLPQRPDVVVISSLLTDAETGTNAYGDVGVSEGTAERLRERAQMSESSIFSRFWNNSRLMRVLKFTTSQGASGAGSLPVEPRVLPEDYRKALKGMVARVKANKALPLLLLEPIDECPQEVACDAYADVVKSVADETDTSLVDGTAVVRDLATGYPFIRRNVLSADGHEQLAKVLTKRIASLMNDRLHKDVQPVRFDDPRQAAQEGRPALILVDPKKLNGEVVFTVQQLQQGPLYYRIVFSVNDSFVADRRLDSRDVVRARFQVPESIKSLPVAKLGLQFVASPPGREDQVGDTDIYLPVPIQLLASRERGVSVRSTTGNVESDLPSTLVAVGFDPQSGLVISDFRVVATSDSLSELERWADKLPWGTVVTLAGSFGKDVTPKPVKFAALELNPKRGENFVALGVTGMRGTGGIVRHGADDQILERGSRVVREMAKFKLESVQNNGSDLLAMDRAWRVSDNLG